ncbi:MAG: sulfatase-like hydrolase/transferase [Deltaproteobacteria bacterium]|nr:sulfatase-like hydrolase/transferase [Deltaproteobacteria bacterium]
MFFRLATCLILVGSLLGACGRIQSKDGEIETPAPPILFITSEALRADAVGLLSGPNPVWPNLRTPHLDQLIGESDWVGTGVAPSSETLPAIASLLTGLRPWQHQVLHESKPKLQRANQTLAEALKEQGYDTTAYVDSRPLVQGRGFEQGFDLYQPLRGGGRTRAKLASWGQGRNFVWIHLAAPLPPYPKQATVPGRKADWIRGSDLEKYRNPSAILSEGLRKRFLQGYSHRVALLDREVGRYLAAVRESGQWDRALIVFTSAHGEEFGEASQVGHGNNLSRTSLEVPLIIKLPKNSRLRFPEEKGGRIATARIWATILEVAGGRSSPAIVSSLFRNGPEGIVSELYRVNGTNQFSLLVEDTQLKRVVDFAATDPDYFVSRRRLEAVSEGPRKQRAREQFLRRHGEGFLSSPPFSGLGSNARVEVEDWGTGEESRLLDPDQQREMERALEMAWASFVDQERTPREEAGWRSER